MNRILVFGSLALGFALSACGSSGDQDDGIVVPRDGGVAVERDGGVVPRDGGPAGVPILGSFQHMPDAVEVGSLGTASLNSPTDVAVNPIDPSQVWVVNQGTESVTVFTNVGTPNMTSQLYRDTVTGPHFLARPSAMAFGMNGAWASAHETDELTQGNATPPDFMGPTLWTADLNDFDGGHAGHLDMLHNSPLGMGIAWDVDNVYWVFDGAHRSVTRYDFAMDHDLGGSDHSDGIIRRYAEGFVLRAPQVPSHMILDHTSGYLYVADSGNNRIAMLDTRTGDPGRIYGPNYDGIREQRMMDDAMIMTLVDGTMVGGMERPSGIALYEGVLYVSDNQSSLIYAFSLEGELLDYLILGRGEGSLKGIDIHDGTMYVVDGKANEILTIRAKP